VRAAGAAASLQGDEARVLILFDAGEFERRRLASLGRALPEIVARAFARRSHRESASELGAVGERRLGLVRDTTPRPSDVRHPRGLRGA
jgi:hypothetical protein